MKEPKYQKLQNNQKQNKKYDFFQEGILPEKEDIKKLKNKSSKKDNKRPPFSLPAELEQKNPQILKTTTISFLFLPKIIPAQMNQRKK